MNRDFKYEWENNGTMSVGSADSTLLNDWATGTIKDTSDVDFWDMQIATGSYYRFEMKVPKNVSVDYDMIIYKDDGSEYVRLNKGMDIDERSDVWLNPGHYYFKVLPYSGSNVDIQYHWISYAV